MDISNVLLRMSYSMPKVLTSEYQSPSIKIENFKVNIFNPFNPISTTWGSENFKPMSYNMPKMLSSKYQRDVIKMKGFKRNPSNPFNPISNKGWGQV